MTLDELEEIERVELQRREQMQEWREDHSLIPIDSESQLDSGFTGRPDTEVTRRAEREEKVKLA